MIEADSPLAARSAHWIAREYQERLEQAGVGFMLPEEVLRATVERTLRRYAADFLGIQETRALLESIEGSYGELIKEVLRNLSLQRMAEALRYLVAEGVSIRNQRALLEAMVDWEAAMPTPRTWPNTCAQRWPDRSATNMPTATG